MNQVESALAVSAAALLIAQLLEKQQHLDHLAHHDQLTGLPNRLYLAAYLPGAIEEARRTSSILAVLFLDLDRFKHIRDSRGHETGDKLLKALAGRIKGTVRTEDVVVRMAIETSLRNEAGSSWRSCGSWDAGWPRAICSQSRPHTINAAAI